MHWDTIDTPLVEFTPPWPGLRHLHPTFPPQALLHRQHRAHGDGKRLNDIVWLHLDGRAMEQDDWTSGSQAIGHVPQRRRHRRQGRPGRTITDDHFLLYFNADGPAR
jgi:glycogen operon protein